VLYPCHLYNQRNYSTVASWHSGWSGEGQGNIELSEKSGKWLKSIQKSGETEAVKTNKKQTKKKRA